MSTLSAIASAGLATSQSQFQASAQRIAKLDAAALGRQPEASGLSNPGASGAATSAGAVTRQPSLESDLVGLLQAKNGFLAHLAVFKASDEMSGALLDLFS